MKKRNRKTAAAKAVAPVGNGASRKDFGNIAEFMAYIDRKDIFDGVTERESLSTGDVGFFGSPNMESAKEMAIHGCPELVARLKPIKAVKRGQGTGRDDVLGVAGYRPLIPALLAGQPMHMIGRVVTMTKRNPTLEILINIGNRGQAYARAIENRGVEIASVVAGLEAVGYSIGITAVSFADGTAIKGGIEARIRIKEQGQMLDRERLVFFTSHASFLRRLVFAYRESVNGAKHDRTKYGYSGNVAPDGYDIYFPVELEINDICSAPEKAAAYVAGIVKAQKPDLLS
jgi:hypothetical protein